MEWVVVATSPHINCFCFFLNDLQVNLSVSGRYLLSCREDNLGKIWLIVVRVKWVAAVVVAPITAFHFSFVCFFLEDLLVDLSILRPFCFRAEIRNNLRKVWQIVGCQGNTRGVGVGVWPWKHQQTSLAHLTSNGKAFQSIGERKWRTYRQVLVWIWNWDN